MPSYQITYQIPRIRRYNEVDEELVSITAESKEYGLSFAEIYSIYARRHKEPKGSTNIFQRLSKLVRSGYLLKNKKSDKEVDYEPTTLTFYLVPELAKEIQKKMLNYLEKIGYEEALEKATEKTLFFESMKALGKVDQQYRESMLEIYLRRIFSFDAIVKRSKELLKNKEEIREKTKVKKRNLSDLDYKFLADEIATSEFIYGAEAGKKTREFIKGLRR
jgi:DNA-binding transcriptional MerR regulator